MSYKHEDNVSFMFQDINDTVYTIGIIGFQYKLLADQLVSALCLHGG